MNITCMGSLLLQSNFCTWSKQAHEHAQCSCMQHKTAGQNQAFPDLPYAIRTSCTT